MQTGWVDPAGCFYPCNTYEHYDLAVELVARIYPEIMDDKFEDTILLDHGWVQITRSQIGQKTQNIYWDKFLSESQKQFLHPYFEDNDEPISSVSRMKWKCETEWR